MKPVLLALPGSEAMAKQVAQHLDAEVSGIETRRFPDGESYIRLTSIVARRRVIVVAALDRPDPKFLPLLFLAGAARDLGARSVGLVCPYLPYMRQDKRFRRGEAVTSTHFAAALSRVFDWLVTVDPHLHRRRDLGEIYDIPARVVHAAPRLAQWIRTQVAKPLLIGPDGESAQWVRAVAKLAGAPSTVLTKRRSGDRAVTVSPPNLDGYASFTPVLVDDVVSTARTMIETVRQVRANTAAAPWCVAIHGVFADGAYAELREAGAAGIATCNTLPHVSNAIDISDLLADAVQQILAPPKSKRRAGRRQMARA